MCPEQPESLTEKHRWRIAALGLVVIAAGIVSSFYLSVRLLPLTLFGVALILTPVLLLIRSHTFRVAYATLFLVALAEFAAWTEYAIHQSGKPLIEGKSDEKVSALYAQIQNGMTRKDVAGLLGSPKVLFFGPGYQDDSQKSFECWRYYNEWQILGDFVEVRFDAAGKVVGKYMGD
jgi:hypothetical protein